MKALTTRTAASVAAVGLTAVAAFQVALALGAPWGAGAWGGEHIRLPPGLRAASGVSAIVLAGAGMLVLTRAGIGRYGHWPNRAVHGATWALTGLLTLSAIGNFASASVWERRAQGPVALVIAGLCLVVARSKPRIRPDDHLSEL